MIRAMATAVALTALGTGSVYAQSSVAASATVVGALDAVDAHVEVKSGVGTIVIQASAPASTVRRGTLEYLQVTRVSERFDTVIDVDGVAEVDVDEADKIRIVVTRVIASNS